MAVFLASGCVSVPSGETGTEQIDPGSVFARLLASDWGPRRGVAGKYIHFNEDGTFTATAGADGRPAKGEFTTLGRTVVLKTRDDEQRCSFGRTSTSLFRTEYLKCGPDRLWALKSTVPAGLARTYRGHKLITMGLRPATATVGLRVRLAPQMGAAHHRCSLQEDEGKPVRFLSVLPTGARMTVIARTVDRGTLRYRNRDITGHWLLIMLAPDGTGCRLSSKDELGWVFGGLVEFE